MTPHLIGALVGGLMSTYIVSRLIRYLVAGNDRRGSVIAALSTMAIAIVGYSFGADSFEQFQGNVWAYIVGALFWLALDVRRAAKAAP